MTFQDVIAIIITVLILTGAIFYIVKEKKKGNKCIGCPLSNSCSKLKKNLRKCAKDMKNEKQNKID